MTSIKIFISHNVEKDFSKMSQFEKEIKRIDGLEPVVILNRKAPRVFFSDQVKAGIEESKYVVPILTSDSIHNIWVNQEIGFAEAKSKLIFPLIDKKILKNIGGFLHQDEEHFLFISNSSKSKEFWSFKKSFTALLNHIKNYEGLKDKFKKQNYQSAVTQGKENKENTHNIQLTSNTQFSLIVKQTKVTQEFVVYISFITDLNEQKWLGFGNVSEINNDKFDSEFIFRLCEPNQHLEYEVKCNFFNKISESSLKRYFKGTPIKINKIRFRSDMPIPEPIHFYYAFEN